MLHSRHGVRAVHLGAYREDRRRDRVLVAKGYLPLRLTWEDVINDPTIVVTAVLLALGRVVTLS